MQAEQREIRDGTLAIRRESDAATSTLILSGELDLANAKTLSAELAAAEAEGLAITLDMRGLEFIDSTGIAVLVTAHNRLNGGSDRLSLIRSDALAVARVMEMTGLDSRLPFVAGPGEPAQV